MDLLDVKISEIKNINLIYLYSTDSIFTKEENKYLAIKVVYDNNNDYIYLDFKDPHFSSLIKRVLDRYNKEKDNRNIVLLGDLTKKLFTDKTILKNAEEKHSFNSEGIALFDSKKDRLVVFEPYLKQFLVDILKTLKQYEAVKIDKIDGYNNKYVVNYSLGSTKKSFPIIITFANDSTINFRIGAVDGLNLNVTGTLTNNLSYVDAVWQSNKQNVQGYCHYDVENNEIERKIGNDDKTLFYAENGETMINDDIELISFYLKLFGINWDKPFIKTSDYNYISGTTINLIEEKENVLVENHGVQLYVKDDRVVLKYKVKNGISKYDNVINVELEFSEYEIILTKLEIDHEIHILIEKVSHNNFGKKYDYEVYKTGNIDFTKPFTTEEVIKIEENPHSLYDIRKKVLNKKEAN